MQKRFRPAALAVPAVLTSLLLAACNDSPTDTTASASATSNDAHVGASASELAEVTRIVPRVVIAHEKGLSVLDTATGEIISETERSGFLRLNNSGDGRHVLVTDGNKFVAFDAALKSRPHGDHAHHYSGDPELRDLAYDAPKAGHVTVHDGLTALFSDGDGTALIVPTDQIAEGYRPADGVLVDSGNPHHGVAVPFQDGSVLITVGTEKERDTIQYRDAAGEILAETSDCPGVHGEATAAGGTAAFGCTNGPVVFDGQEFHKITPAAGVEYQRSGNLAGHPDSPIVLGDYKVDEDADQEHPTQINLIDTRSHTMRQVELDSSYWFRSLGRGPAGEALVLTYDGHLKVIDPESGEITADIPAIEAWEEKKEWQEPGPILQVAGDIAYVTDAEKQELVLIDLKAGAVSERFPLGVSPVEIAVVDGVAAADAEGHHHH
ncbi:hypothetical protein [Corynebacterium sp.]|uniref:hypothetical protein n=1 Tax=Corynebacterium sp. TaxID=1720 RepID=UPI0026DF6923|nr:hypothetical protein [Corynebacterium sp.]MDO5512627.1 hypothetical protein [Corynebacterium sp.]